MLSTLSTLLKRWNGQRFSSAGVTNASVALGKLSHCQRFFSAGNSSNTAMNTNFGRRSLHAYKPVVTGACVYLSQNNVQRLRSYKIYGSFYGSTLSQGYKWYPKTPWSGTKCQNLGGTRNYTASNAERGTRIPRPVRKKKVI